MTQETKHTPTPWVLDEREELKANIYSDDETGTLIASCKGFAFWRPVAEQQANATHIVRCVNSRDALVEALKDLRREYVSTVELAVEIMRELGRNCDEASVMIKQMERACRVTEALAAAGVKVGE